jgi:uncharacterized membrane-anchored protein YitT (DUF2179 family)
MCKTLFSRNELKNLLYVVAGSLMLALGVTLFLQPNQIASGGTPGIAILINHLTGISVGAAMLVVNIPLLVIGFCLLGQGIVWRTLIAVTAISAFVDLLNIFSAKLAVPCHPMLAALCAGAVIGTGVGLILKGNASAGGPTIIAKVLMTYTRIRPGQLLMVIDILIVVSSGVVFGVLSSALWSLITVVVTGRCIDLVISDDRSGSIVQILRNYSFIKGLPLAKPQTR